MKTSKKKNAMTENRCLNMTRRFIFALFFVMGCMQMMATAIIPYGQWAQKAWTAKGFYALREGQEGPGADWFAESFDDSSWENIVMPLSNVFNLFYYNTEWTVNYSSYWVRYHFNLDHVDSANPYYFYSTHDDECVAYINGVQFYNNGGVGTGVVTKLSNEAVSALKKGDNVIAVYVSDSGGGSNYLDFGLYEFGSFEQRLMDNTELPFTIINDETYPWIVDGGDPQGVVNGNRGTGNTISDLTIQYSSNKQTEFAFDWKSYDYSNHYLKIIIDGKERATVRNNTSYSELRYYLAPGNHTILFRDTVGNYNSNNNWSCIKNVRVKEFQPLESVLLTKRSKRMTFTNDPEWPWMIAGKNVQNTTSGVAKTATRFKTTIKVDKTSKLSFQRIINGQYNYDYYYNLLFLVNGNQFMRDWDVSRFADFITVLEPGTYTLEWKDTTMNTTYTHNSRIRNVELYDNWITCELAKAGTLGVEALYQVDVLNDVEMLKVVGSMNDADWTTIKNMNNLLALDLSEAHFDELPSYVFDGKSLLGSVILPEGLKKINEYAFRKTSLRKIHIPSTVSSIERYAFAGTPIYQLDIPDNSQLQAIREYAFSDCTLLKEINIGSNSQLETIERYAFNNCNTLISFDMPNTVTSLGRGALVYCRSLKHLWLSDGLTMLPLDAVSENNSLVDLHLPVNLEGIAQTCFYNSNSLRHIDFPESLKTIGYRAFYHCGIDSLLLPLKLDYLSHYAFQGCPNLKYVELPSYIQPADFNYDGYRILSGMRSNFNDCNILKKIVCRSATPPSIIEDPFAGCGDKSLIELVVPSFAVVNYKLDTYWYQFGSIIEGDDIDYWKITSPLSLTNNRRMNGKPNIDLYYGGELTVGGNAPMKVGEFNWFVNESTPGRLFNTCGAMTADNVNTYFSVGRNTWYFFTPVYDVNLSEVTVSNNASYVFRYYDSSNRATNGAGASWKNVEDGTLHAGLGYIFHCNADAVITMPAASTERAKMFNTEDVTHRLIAHAAENSADKNWNYVGNPYPCYFDIYYLDFTAPITVWVGNTYRAYSIVDDDLVLRPMQPFFVQKPDAIDNIIFNQEGRQLSSVIERPSYVKERRFPSKVARHLFNIKMTQNDLSDETRVVINSEAALQYELERDASKFMSFDAEVPQIFTLDQEGNHFAINERPLANGQVMLAYYAGKEGLMTISATRSDGDIYLYDHLLNKKVNLSEEDYQFFAEVTDGVDISRFTLSLNVDDEADGLANVVDNEKITVYGKDGVLSINASNGTAITIFRTDGSILFKGIATGRLMKTHVPAGAYIVRVGRSVFKTLVD